MPRNVVDERIFSATKALLKTGESHRKIAEYMAISNWTVSMIGQADSLAGYHELVAARTEMRRQRNAQKNASAEQAETEAAETKTEAVANTDAVTPDEDEKIGGPERDENEYYKSPFPAMESPWTVTDAGMKGTPWVATDAGMKTTAAASSYQYNRVIELLNAQIGLQNTQNELLKTLNELLNAQVELLMKIADGMAVVVDQLT